MNSMKLIGLNTKWYRYQNRLTQEGYANKTKFKMALLVRLKMEMLTLLVKT